ncbi:MAG: hypothetical protein BRD48_00935 [Bacteroidetes bacterium QS_9_68_14]|nr:MAG: hypothetical protein BRD48_00935 [Bacteroidetes bacterium QS_9_68_14]
MTAAAITAIAPSRPRHVLLTSFFYPELRHSRRTTLVPPIIRPAVQSLEPEHGNHVLVYFNQTQGAGAVLDALRRVDVPFVAYNFGKPERPKRYSNITFKQPSLEGFLGDLARSRAVLCTAGFTLISEGLYLGKPLMVAPNGGIFEQTLNARFLEKEGLGEAAAPGDTLTAGDVRGFLRRAPRYAQRLDGFEARGNEAAVACIEDVLRSVGAAAPPRTSVAPRAASPSSRSARAPARRREPSA